MFVDVVADDQREKIGDPLMTAEFRQRVRHSGKEADQKPDVHNASLHNSSLATISPWPLCFHYTQWQGVRQPSSECRKGDSYYAIIKPAVLRLR